MTSWAPPDIIAAALDGNQESVERLISAIWPGCFRLAATLIGDRSLAQDAAQEACAIVHRKVRGLRNMQAFDAWLYRIVMREAARVRSRHGTVAESTYERAFESDETTALDVSRALASLPSDLRDVTVLFYFDDLKCEEIAGILRVAHATVRTRLSRARERLRALLGDYNADVLPTHLEKQHAL
jgi:RNA polymerase sigma-70 factor (ECF subfamily)